MDLATSEIEVLKVARDRLDGELAETAGACKEAIARLEGAVEQLRAENGELRQMVMLEKVPPALYDALAALSTDAIMQVRAIGDETRQAVVAYMEGEIDRSRLFWVERMQTELHPIAQGVARLLTAQGKGEA